MTPSTAELIDELEHLEGVVFELNRRLRNANAALRSSYPTLSPERVKDMVKVMPSSSISSELVRELKALVTLKQALYRWMEPPW